VECKVSWPQSGLIFSLVLNGGETIIILNLKQRVYNICVKYAGGKRHAQFLKVKMYVHASGAVNTVGLVCYAK
jgi:hypothetical protein